MKKQDENENFKQEAILMLTSFLNSSLSWLFGFLVTIPVKGTWIYARFVFGLFFCLFNFTKGLQLFITYFDVILLKYC